MKYPLIFLSLILSSYACNTAGESSEVSESDSLSVEQTTTDDSGVDIEIIQEGQGPKPNPGDIVTVHYTGTLPSTGEVFDSSVEKNRPFLFAIGKGHVIPGWDIGIAKLNVGAKAILHIPANLAYGDRATGPIPPNSDLDFEVEILNIEPAPKPIVHSPYDTEGMDERVTDSGIRYFLIEEGDGANISAGSRVKVHYYGYFPETAEKFDNSFERGQPIQVIVGQGQVIPGWEEALTLLKDGGKGKFIIPSSLAYGERGYPGIIPPNADLAFDLQIMKVE
jgi:FKBP-type peptidyl-prolyl cis-trans isomerase